MTRIITLPGLIDPHVHLRDPGQTHKEDFYTGTSAALAGGYTTVLDMPNNAEPITTPGRLEAKIASAKKQVVSDIGFHFGTLGDNFADFEKVIDKVMGLKVYMNVTTGNFIVNANTLTNIYRAWPGTKPILLHAEDDVSDTVMKTLATVPRATHICHVSSQVELEFVMRAKEKGYPLTCGVTPHHLFLTREDGDELGAYGHMKPFLKSQKDINFIWEHLDAVDVIESDHAPHTRKEKNSATPPFGVPGLETTLPLMLTAVAENKLTQAQLVKKLHVNVAHIFNITVDESTRVEIDMSEFEIKNEKLLTKCGWSPFSGRKVVGQVKTVYIRGTKVFEHGKVLAAPGSGQII
jgi:dihydroorotase